MSPYDTINIYDVMFHAWDNLYQPYDTINIYDVMFSSLG